MVDVLPLVQSLVAGGLFLLVAAAFPLWIRRRDRAHRRLAVAAALHETLLGALSGLGEGVLVTDGRRILYANDAMAVITGYSVEELLAHPALLDIIAPEERAAAAERMRRRLAGERMADHYETAIVHKDGRRVDVEVAVKLLRVDGARHIMALARDITERKRPEEALRTSEAALAEAQRLAHIGSWNWDVPADRVAWSDELYRIYGLAPEEFGATYEGFLERVHPDDRQMVDETVRRSFATGEPFAFDHHVVRPDGVVRILHGRGEVVQDAAGNTVRMFGTGQDITERRRVEEALRASEEQFRAVAETALDAIVSADARGVIVYFNKGAEAVFGYAADEVLGRPLTVLMPERFQEAHRRGVLRFGRGGRSRVIGRTVELAGRRRDGTEFPLELSLATWRKDGAAFFTGIIRDITERKRAEEALRGSERRYAEAYERERASAERLRALDEMKDTFLSAVSHELRTPLTAVLGFAETLREMDRQLTDTDREAFLSRLVANAEKLGGLLADLLDLERLTRGMLELRRRPTDLARLVGGVVEQADLPDDRPVSVEAEPFILPVDGPKVERIVENLVVNAVRHTPPGTPVWVRVRPERGGALVVVEDAGHGVPEEMREAVFEAFRQGPDASPPTPGVGIGLTLVRRFAELHGGRAWVEEREGRGASFRVFLPGPSAARRPDTVPA